MARIVKVAPTEAPTHEFYIDTVEWPGGQKLICEGTFTVVSTDPPSDPARVIRAAEMLVRYAVGDEAYVDFSRACNWHIAAKVAAGLVQVTSA